MNRVSPMSSESDDYRLARLRNVVSDSRTSFDTFLIEADTLIRSTTEMLQRADEITFPQSLLPLGGEEVIVLPEAEALPVVRPQPPEARPALPAVLPPRPPVQIMRDRVAPVVVVIGPVDRLGEVEDLTIELESAPEIDVHFRLFRAGAYRVDASCSDIEGLVGRLRTRKDVLDVQREGATVHVLPAPATL